MKIKTILLATMSLIIGGGNVMAATIKADDKVLVVYYSRSGNTQEIAQYVHNAIGGDIVRLETVNAYPDDYNATTEQAKKEISEGIKPELKTKISNIADYDVIFVGSPCWWGTVASPVTTFLSEYDLSGKTIIPFMTHGGSGLGHSVDDIKKILPNSTVVEGEAFWGRFAKNANKSVQKWVKGLQND